MTISFHSSAVQVLATSTADGSGAFRALVTVPAKAPSGWHQLQATGLSPARGVITLESPVLVAGLASHPSARPASQIAIMVALALVIPILTWLALGVWGRLRRRPNSAA